MPARRYAADCQIGPADEERAQAIEVERGLLRLAHGLDDRRQREQLLADEADHEVVVVAVEAMAGEADIVRQIGGAEGHADGAVLGEDGALLFGRELRETAAAPQRIPRRPSARPG